MDWQLFRIARQGNVNKLQKIIDEEAHLLEGKTPRRNTALHIASRLGHTGFAEAIIRERPLLLLSQNCRGDTALHVAARAGLSDVVDKLIDRAEREHFKEHMLRMVNCERNTVLHEAARNNHDRVLLLLLNKQLPDLVYEINKDRASALYMAAEGGCLESVKRILAEVKILRDKEKRKAACGGPDQRTPLHAAVMRQCTDITQELIMEMTEFTRIKDAHGRFPLHYASALGNSETVKIMLQYDTSAAYLTNDDGQLPFHVAGINGCIDVLKEFRQYCPDSSEAIDKKGWNALHFAVESWNFEVVKHILNSYDLGELINEPNDDGNTPLHLAISKHQFSTLILFLGAKGVDVNVTNHEGKTALDIAQSDKELISQKFQKFIICNALRKVGGKKGLHAIDKADKKSEYNSYRNMVEILSLVAGLIQFAALFTIPGGFNSDGPNKGKPNIPREPLLWAFIITDAISLFTALYIAMLLFFTAAGDPFLLVASVSTSLEVMLISLGFLALSFIFGLWLVLSKVVALTFLTIFIVVFLWFFCLWVGPVRSLVLPFSFSDLTFLALASRFLLRPKT